MLCKFVVVLTTLQLSVIERLTFQGPATKNPD